MWDGIGTEVGNGVKIGDDDHKFEVMGLFGEVWRESEDVRS